MDPAVAIVQAYLHLNGYFTVTEYPLVEAMRGRGRFRTSTDLDVLAVRFPDAARVLVRDEYQRRRGRHVFDNDPKLGGVDGRIDMLIGEVKEGRAQLNRGARDPQVLRAVLARFGCCPPEHVDETVERLLGHGAADMGGGHHARLIAFGSTSDGTLGYPCKVILLRDVVRFVRRHLREHWDVLRHAQSKDPALGLLMTLQKAIGPEEDAAEDGVEMQGGMP